MKDEEMAHEYAICRTYPKFETNHIATFVLREVEGAFLAGLKAGRPQWHDLRKDPNDLPKDSKEVLIVTSDNRKHIGFYDKDWYCNECGGIVIKWCEIPTFDKE